MLEALISVGLLAVAIAVFLSVWLASNLNKSVQNLAVANRVATREVEKIRAKPWSEISNGANTISDPALSSLPQGAGTTTVSNYLATSTMKQIEVTIQWRQGGETQRTHLYTVVVEGGTNP